ncbi:5-formyltetrahydrofolate cyclo-ligase [Nesterenkonia lutea]|uniref:5-formyltetrahydrofolate cyclo-ligase n=1 Tax=Nesterenkonia lutea TaxID=272919 RepID=A0ABR9JC03_9MICC|nr:5-formyltetrahydrofolate cyclo-ligase [Nesterenkonia lutea]MBE1523462.1 5-formyltetrahydrofolate cyclo-ligase [Nesterenkonia lutea]
MTDEPMPVQEAKAAVRRRLRAQRRKLSVDDLTTRGESLAAVLREVVPAGSAVTGYLPMPGEPDLRPFLRQQRRGGGEVYLPVAADPRRRELQWVAWNEDTVLKRHEVLPLDEPVGDRISTTELLIRHPGLTVLVPGLAVDADGARLGQGGGFYDSTFGPGAPSMTAGGARVGGGVVGHPAHLSPRFLAVVHAEEVFERAAFPVESHDLRVHGIVTERGAMTVSPL